ncbi:hypothetical protein EII26_08790 [Fretibacterium sp. OH1220_COT-178]|nr:hypothetical protein EII26_08790 [Fretibacterium sp. OH1220_COT-178]
MEQERVTLSQKESKRIKVMELLVNGKNDTTGLAVDAGFTKNESTAGYVSALDMGLNRYGPPMEIYSGRHSMPRFLDTRSFPHPRRRERRAKNAP